MKTFRDLNLNDKVFIFGDSNREPTSINEAIVVGWTEYEFTVCMAIRLCKKPTENLFIEICKDSSYAIACHVKSGNFDNTISIATDEDTIKNWYKLHIGNAITHNKAELKRLYEKLDKIK